MYPEPLSAKHWTILLCNINCCQTPDELFIGYTANTFQIDRIMYSQKEAIKSAVCVVLCHHKKLWQKKSSEVEEEEEEE